MTQVKRGRPRKVKTDENVEVQTKAETQAVSKAEKRLKVLKPNAIFDGEGGFYPVGHMIAPVDDQARASLIAKGLAE